MADEAGLDRAVDDPVFRSGAWSMRGKMVTHVELHASTRSGSTATMRPCSRSTWRMNASAIGMSTSPPAPLHDQDRRFSARDQDVGGDAEGPARRVLDLQALELVVVVGARRAAPPARSSPMRSSMPR